MNRNAAIAVIAVCGLLIGCVGTFVVFSRWDEEGIALAVQHSKADGSFINFDSEGKSLTVDPAKLSVATAQAICDADALLMLGVNGQMPAPVSAVLNNEWQHYANTNSALTLWVRKP